MTVTYLLDPEGPPSLCDGCGAELLPGTTGAFRLAPGVELRPDVILTNDNSWIYCSADCANRHPKKAKGNA